MGVYILPPIFLLYGLFTGVCYLTIYFKKTDIIKWRDAVGLKAQPTFVGEL